MKKYHGIYLLIGVSAATALVVIAGCATSHFHSSRKPADENFEAMKGNYDKIHPLYAIACASSKFDQKGEAPGGPYGHTFMYLKGACRDKTANFPKVKVCDDGTDLTNPESGVGVALDKTFQNTRFIASDGYNFLINGDLAADAPLNTDAFEAAVRKFVADGDAKGVILHAKDLADKKNPSVNKGDPNMSDEEWVAREVIGSSFAVDFARNLGCVAIPINAAMLAAGVDYLNTQNEPFTSGKKQFDWNPVSDQCVQFVHNVLASMGIGNHQSQSSDHGVIVKGLLEVRDFASYAANTALPFIPSVMTAPANELIKTDKETNGAKIYTLQEAYKNKKVRKNFQRFGRLVATDGVLVWLHPAHPTDNEYFNVEAQLKLSDIPIIHPAEREFRKVTEMASTTMISDNLVTFQKKLQDTISSMDIEGRGIDSTEYCDFAAVQNRTPNSGDFKSFCKDYTAYLIQAKTDAANNMVKLNSM